MKKLFASLLVLSMVLVGCGPKDNPGEKDEKPEVVMLTDKGTIDDKAFNQGTYEGIKAYCGDKISHKYIKPAGTDTDAYCNAIDQAVKEGAKIVVCPGFLFEEAIYIQQEEYKDVKFILIDGNPHNADYSDFKTGDNTVGIKFKEEQSGYLAGYAAVKDGHTGLGFMGGQAVPAVMNFGYGYIQGANDAAKELGITVDMKYHYTGGFSASPEIQTKASAWYKAGATAIFSCGGAVGNSVMAAADAANPKGKVIGVDVDQSSESPTVFTSAMKQLGVAVEKALDSIYNGDFDKKDDKSVLFKGGANIVLGAKDDAVCLPMNTSHFEKFTEADYKAVYAKIVDGTITIQDCEDGKLDISAIKCPNVKLTVEK